MNCLPPLHVSTTLHYMAGNDYRADRRQVSFVVDSALWGAAKGSAAARGWSVTRLITELLEKEVGHGVTGIGSGDRVGVASSGNPYGTHGGGSGAGHSQPGTARRGVDPAPAELGKPDWDAILASGFAAKVGVVRDVTSQVDPIEEIA